ncbi:MAG: hypothetical protein KDK90_26880 [Leptospiraceae bacterium]|nr:hypothetical protein [Leptospiraceae bacterium]
MYEIEYTQDAINDLKWFKKNEQKTIIDMIDLQLKYEPLLETRNRKQLRTNSTAEWELRIGDFRVFYNVFGKIYIVEIERIGEKFGNRIFFQGKEEKL